MLEKCIGGEVCVASQTAPTLKQKLSGAILS
jgi:hypothetical protein